ncbi:MAG: RNA polymerase-binding protein RbpA [Actinomycetaceae bacterium]|nr:RNA polymerase-binding protein RbpA [Actinomycetaceae bacterium]
MAERSLRGMKIGANSLETENGVKFVARAPIYYVCPQGHEFPIAMVLEVEPPTTWECRCGQQAQLRDRDNSEDEENVKPARTHWDMLMERRSEEELQVLLDERLKLLREGKLRLRFRHR